jgi:hypothetical protein
MYLQDDRVPIIQFYQLYLIQTSTVMNRLIQASLLTWKRVVKVKRLRKHYFDFQTFYKLFIDFFHSTGWHYCGKNQAKFSVISTLISFQLQFLDIDGRQATFLCPNGTQFSQAVFVCDWWFNVRCDLSPRLYSINARLYQRPKVNPTKPHRIITKELVEDIFNK